MSGRRLLLIETATRQAVVGLAATDGSLVGADQWQSAHRHGEELLSRLDRLLGSNETARDDVAAVVAGTGPGSFTGLRIGLATAKTIAYSLGLPIIGLSTMRLLARAAAPHTPGRLAVLLPAGVGDRYLARYATTAGELDEVLAPALVPAAAVPDHLAPDEPTVAVDLPADEMDADADELGRLAQQGLAVALASLGAAALESGELADVAALVAEYVALPRGVPVSAEEVAWSPDLR